jgi:tellurite resistance protein
MESSIKIIRVWAAAAWADGKLHNAEAAALRRLIDASDDLGPDERKEAMDYLKGPPTIDLAAEIKSMTKASREGALRAAQGIVRLDGKVTDDESAFLGKLQDLLGLDSKTVSKIKSE